MALNPDHIAGYVRVCPVCATHAAADATQCAQCGTLLLGVDLTLPAASVMETASEAAPPPASPSASPICPHADCGQANPPGSDTCLYCGRPLPVESVPSASTSRVAALYKLPGVLAEKFRIAEVLPAGGAEAEIMLLEGLGSGVKVIAKLYRPGLLPKSEVLERVGRVAFSHVVHLLAWGEADGIGYEVMEYCPHGSLRQLMREGELPRDRLRRIVEELSAALDALHALGVIHRDLKPENVLLRHREPLDLVLTDFGIASLSDATQVFTSLAHSIKYGAPETLAGVLDRAADWWSLGMILTELLAGQHPFDGLSEAVITHRLVTAEIDLDGVSDPHWRMLCRGLLLRDPERRWRGPEVARWLAGDVTLVLPVDTPVMLPRSVRPYRIGESLSTNARELAVALATHWAEGCKDLARGQLSTWLGQELQDDNLLRFVQDLLELRGVSDDLRLLRLIRKIAPDLPPAWRGASLAQPGLVAQAARAEQGDRAAADWLCSVFDQRALRELALTQHPAEVALAARWEEAQAQFVALWRDAERELTHWRTQITSRAGVADYDAIVFGQPDALPLPSATQVHPPLLLALADAPFATALHARLERETAPWRAQCQWLEKLLLPATPAAHLVALHLLPQARRILADAEKRLVQETATVATQREDQTQRVNLALATLRERLALGMFADNFTRNSATRAVQDALDLLLELRNANLPEDAAALRALRRAEPVLLRIEERLDAWTHAAEINSAWRNRQLVQGVGFAGFVLLSMAAEGTLSLRILGWLLAVPAFLVAWRLVGLMGLRDDIRKLVQALPLRVLQTTSPS